MQDIDRLVRACFTDGSTFDFPEGVRCEVAVLDLGTLKLPTGRLALADPTYDLDDFTDTQLTCADLGPGDHTVEASVFRPRTRDGRRLASLIAAVRVGTPGPGEWTPAWEREGVPLGVAVDSGTIAAFDVAARSELPLTLDDESVEVEWAETVVDRGFLVSELDPGLGSMVVYQSSLGDGAYAPWVQRNSQGTTRCVVVDMGIVPLT